MNAGQGEYSLAFRTKPEYNHPMTSKTLEAIVEGGALRPLKLLGLEQQHVLMTVVSLTDEPHDAVISCHDMAIGMGVIGAADDTLHDVSTNPAHLPGFGN